MTHYVGRHEAVVAAVAEKMPTMPLRFATVLPDREAVQAVLREHEAEWKARVRSLVFPAGDQRGEARHRDRYDCGDDAEGDSEFDKCEAGSSHQGSPWSPESARGDTRFTFRLRVSGDLHTADTGFPERSGDDGRSDRQGARLSGLSICGSRDTCQPIGRLV